MCGINGVYQFKGSVQPKSIISMNNCLKHRGPDNGAFKIFNNVGLGHRRLSIIDLSDEANQPMDCHNNRYTIVFNGEVFNYIELKNQLISKGVVFSTNSDTEVVLKTYIHFGTNAFQMFNGMFALAIYDKIKKELILARD